MGVNFKKGKINFGIIGGGWRAEFYLRIARELSDIFNVLGIVDCDKEKGKIIEKKWGIKTFRTIDEFLKFSNPLFAVAVVPWSATPVVIKQLVERKIPVLSETPPAADMDNLIELYKFYNQRKGSKVQISEQYPFQPLNNAYISVIESGRLGTITQAQVSVAHGYHGISMIRKMLNITFEDAVITGCNFVSPVIAGPGRSGPPAKKKIENSAQAIAYIDFGKKLGIYDFTGEQYFSWIRSSRVLVRGERGEINNTTVKYLKDFKTPIEFELRRQNAGENGNLEGLYFKGVLAGEEWIYKNPFIPARLTDDEIAVATSLKKMAEYVQTGKSFYSLAEASQDRYLDLMISKAIETKESIKTSKQLWAGK